MLSFVPLGHTYKMYMTQSREKADKEKQQSIAVDDVSSIFLLQVSPTSLLPLKLHF